MDLISVVRDLGVSRKHSKHNDDVFVDRLNHRYTVAILVIFCVVVTASQYFGAPIQCWVPGHFTGNYEKYADRICWVSNTYNVPMNEDIPHEEPDRRTKMVKYYQWTPFILLFQALLFYIPRMIWRSMNDKSGLDLQSMVDIVHNYQKDASKSLERDKLLTYLANEFNRYVSSNPQDMPNSNNKSFIRRRKTVETELETEETDEFIQNKNRVQLAIETWRRFFRIFCLTKGKRYGNFLLVLFVFVKILYTFNSIIQLFILNSFLGNDYLILGIEILTKIWYGEDWSQLKRFPRVTLCDFRVREVGIVHRYTVQCVLSINLFNEKIFIFIWYWLCLVSLFNIFDLLSWSYTLIINSHERYMYIKRRILALKDTNSSTQNLARIDKELFKEFVNNYLKEDGVLALRLLSRNAHDLIVSEVVSKLYDLYSSQNFQKDDKNP